MIPVKTWYERATVLQRGRMAKIAASVVALLLCAVVFGSLLMTVSRIDGQRRALIAAMTDQSLRTSDELAVSLRDTGTITVNGVTYGGDEVAKRPDLVFDREGTIDRPDLLADVFLRAEYPTWAPRWMLEQPRTTMLLGAVTLAWLLLIIWMEITVPFLLTLLVTAVPVVFFWLIRAEGMMWAAGGIGVLTFTFVLLSRVAMAAMNRPNQLLAVAHTVLKEASRTKIPLVFIIFLLIVLPLLPLTLDPDAPLRFRIQTYISRSLGLTFYVTACMTLFLACATVAFEVRDRQIWQLVTKPLGRFRYLLGKWLGVVTVNAIILIIAGLASFTFIQFLREAQVAPGMSGAADAQLVRDAVLTARVGREPDYATLSEEQIQSRIEDAILRRPDLQELAAQGDISVALRRELRRQLEDSYEVGQRSVPPGQTREYVFTGLSGAKRLQSTLTLRYRFHILRDDEHETFKAGFMFNEDPELILERTFVPTMSHVLSVPSDWIREDGTLMVTIGNPLPPRPDKGGGYGAINFEGDDFELLYKVDTFESNFARALLVDWVKLSFLAMLGIASATFLSFSVACLTSYTIFLAGTIGPFLAVSLKEYVPVEVQNMDWKDFGMVIHWVFQTVIRFIGMGVVFVLEAFGSYRPTQSLVEGRLIPWSAVGSSALRIGVVWSGIAMIVGFLVLRKRQLAIYSGQG